MNIILLYESAILIPDKVSVPFNIRAGAGNCLCKQNFKWPEIFEGNFPSKKLGDKDLQTMSKFISLRRESYKSF